MPAMVELERHPRQPAEPEEHRLLRSFQTLRQGLGRLEERLLEHIRRINSASQTRVEAQGDHPPQAPAVPGKHLVQGRLIAPTGQIE
jgi:hypothetical protein